MLSISTESYYTCTVYLCYSEITVIINHRLLTNCKVQFMTHVILITFILATVNLKCVIILWLSLNVCVAIQCSFDSYCNNPINCYL